MKLEKRIKELSRVLKAESELGADYLKHMMPIAEELAAQKAAPKRIRHRGKPVTPFKVRGAKREK